MAGLIITVPYCAKHHSALIKHPLCKNRSSAPA